MDAKKRKEARAIGERIFQLRQRLGLSQRQLATGTSISAVYICRIEKGDRLPSLRVIRELAEGLGVSAHYLETGEEPPRPTLEGFTRKELIQEIGRRTARGYSVIIEGKGIPQPKGGGG